jgi:pimeloyl-ACP methyl ester carboxylesterase/thioredoxin reductase
MSAVFEPNANPTTADEDADATPGAPLDHRTDRVLVIGAGSSGLAAAKALREYGHRVDIAEREDAIGGNWNFGKSASRVYASTHMISSKPFTQFPDFPMRYEDPDYLHHSQVLRYLEDYAKHFGLDAVTELSTSVVRMAPVDEEDPRSGWDVVLQTPDGERRRRYAAVVIANGHNWFPKMPDVPGPFDGEIIHSAEYERSDQLRGKRVLVVGAGNTGCDVVVEAAQAAEKAFHSTRRGYWYAQKYTFGRPSDQIYDALLSLRLPLPVLRFLLESTAKLTVGDLTKFGLPKPDHEFLETHPIVNSLLVYYVGHGDITPKPDVERFDGAEVVFTDGSREEVDLVVFCTGYLIEFPFVDRERLNWRDGRPRLYKNVFHPHRDDLAVIGLIQPDSGQFKLVHWQSVAVARWLRVLEDADASAIDAFRKHKRDHVDEDLAHGVKYKNSTRHYLEINHMTYLRRLRKDVIDRLPVAPPRALQLKREPVMTPLKWSFPPREVELELVHRSGQHPGEARGLPPLLFVHGLLGGAWWFDEHWLPELARRGWDAWAVSLRGHGRSGGRPGAFRAYEEDVLQALSRMPAPPVVIGHSMGGAVVQRVLERYPARGGILLCSAAPDHGLRSGFALARRRPLAFLKSLVGLPETFTDAELYGALRPDDAEVFRARSVPPSALNRYQVFLPRRVRAARAPMAVLGGREDGLLVPTEVERTAQVYGVQPRWVDASHLPMLDRNWKRTLDELESVIRALVEPERLTARVGEDPLSDGPSLPASSSSP